LKNDLDRWIGHSEVARDVVSAAPLLAMHATLDSGNRMPAEGQPLPPLWHWLYFLPHPKRTEIGPDGHAARGGFLPPVPLPRRMWAGGRLEWHDAIRVGDAIERISRVEDVSTKRGKSGDLVFVLVGHSVSTARGIALVEEHDIVYRDMPAPGSIAPTPPAARTDEAWSERIEPDEVLLFRYSALTFNGHRIHYDRRYVTEVEGYPGLIVHGPLIATLLMELLRQRIPNASVARFAFRAISPLFDIAPFEVCGRPADDGATVDLWARRLDGGLAMTATVTLGAPIIHEDAP
jgi:3-methylfumaryl-CoA hydratase